MKEAVHKIAKENRKRIRYKEYKCEEKLNLRLRSELTRKGHQLRNRF
jgi:hypothetical protein